MERKPADWEHRELIRTALDETMLVEAAAGTGKTTSMVGRMVGLLAEGKCLVDGLAAVTFTRKAAAELRSRFQVAIEAAARDATGDARERLSAASEHLERCTIGTIHSFCARLLRERPVEAGVDLGFEEMDDAEDARMCAEAWGEFAAELFAEDDPALGELEDVGLEIGDLGGAFLTFATYPDVDDWPCPERPMPDLAGATADLESYAAHMASLLPTFPTERGTDKLMDTYERIVRAVSHSDLNRTPELMEVLAEFGAAKVTQKMWPGGKEQAKVEESRYVTFQAQIVEPLLTAWREHRYPLCIRLLRRAVDHFAERRRRAGKLNYQDLLMHAAALLRDKPHVRTYLRRRFTHLLVDEFQDTDPIQAEVMLLLTADNPNATEWRKCRPVPGSLFVVGDPKQSIYRFRRADIATYNQVKEIIRGCGRVVELSTNFRAQPAVIEWVNGAFEQRFASPADDYSPAHVELEPFKEGEGAVLAHRIPVDLRRGEDMVALETDLIARHIRGAVDAGAKPSDYLIVTKQKANLSTYAAKLEEYGIPHLVTGGSTMNQVRELGLLRTCLWAVTEPDNAVALLAALRSELFGVSDRALYRFKRSGGRFSYLTSPPQDRDEAIADAFTHLRRHSEWLDTLPPVTAIEKVIDDVGLPALAAASPSGNVMAGSLAKAIELLRSVGAEAWSLSEIVDYLGELVEQNETCDGAPAVPSAESAVWVMNLHKAKGLESEVVFLADPTHESSHQAELHVDRSAGHARGYLAITKGQGEFQRETLAQPVGWGELKAVEQLFADAEQTRLLYVACTRAKHKLVVTVRGDSWKKNNPWQSLSENLGDCASLADPGPIAAPKREMVSLSAEDAAEDFSAIQSRLTASRAPTYAYGAAKQIALGEATEFHVGSEDGAKWGSLIHLLLDAAMRLPEADIRPLAASALEEAEMDPGLAEEAVATVRKVAASGIWRRARASERVLTEVPFEILLDGGSPVPTLVRGAIDLVFHEAAGWVIVDYKTDRIPSGGAAELVERYRPQVGAYADVWGRLTGQHLTEMGVYLVTDDQYVTL